LLHAVAQTSNLNHQEIRAALGARAVTFIGTAMDHVEEPSPTSGSASISKSQVVTVPSFSHFIDEMQPVRPGQVARLVLGERSRQQKGLRITDVTLDLQAINDRDEIVWLRQSVTITGFRREGTFDVPQKQARYEAMEDLRQIVEETLEARGFRVRAGRYVLPRDLVPINGAFDCAEWYRDEEDVPRVRPVAPVTPGQRYLPGYEPSI
jgi:hypothetical protein